MRIIVCFIYITMINYNGVSEDKSSNLFEHKKIWVESSFLQSLGSITEGLSQQGALVSSDTSGELLPILLEHSTNYTYTLDVHTPLTRSILYLQIYRKSQSYICNVLLGFKNSMS